MIIREEIPTDVDAIRLLTELAFNTAPHASGAEAKIIDRLRQTGALTLSLVAVRLGDIIGHVAFSPVVINGVADDWFGLGPVSVKPDWQGLGIGTELIGKGIDCLKNIGAGGCVVLGDPDFYQRFGFACDPVLRYGVVPQQYFQALSFTGAKPEGEVGYHPAFSL